MDFTHFIDYKKTLNPALRKLERDQETIDRLYWAAFWYENPDLVKVTADADWEYDDQGEYYCCYSYDFTFADGTVISWDDAESTDDEDESLYDYDSLEEQVHELTKPKYNFSYSRPRDLKRFVLRQAAKLGLIEQKERTKTIDKVYAVVTPSMGYDDQGYYNESGGVHIDSIHMDWESARAHADAIDLNFAEIVGSQIWDYAYHPVENGELTEEEVESFEHLDIDERLAFLQEYLPNCLAEVEAFPIYKPSSGRHLKIAA